MSTFKLPFMNLKFTVLKTAFILPILFALVSQTPALAAASHSNQAIVQHSFEGKKAIIKKQRFITKFLHHSKVIGLEKKKTDKLAIAVFIGGLVSFLLFFPIKFFLGFAILGLATLITSIFAFRRIKRDGTGGKWLVILGVLFVLLTAGFIGLVIAALNKFQ